MTAPNTELVRNNHKNTIFVGRGVFEQLKSRLGVIYGSKIICGEIKIVQDQFLGDYNMVTFDPDLIKKADKLKQLNSRGE